MVRVVDTSLSLSLPRRYLGESSVGNEVVETAQSSIIRKNCHVSSIALDIDMGSRYEMKHHPCHEILVHVTLRLGEAMAYGAQSLLASSKPH